MEFFAQPNASAIPRRTLERIVATVRPHAVPELDAVRQRDGHSNDFAEVPLDDGEVLVVKRGRFDWSRARFDTSRIASRIIRSATDVTVPEPLPVPGELDARPLEAYWWIDHPTLNQLWPALDPDERDSALRSWGELIARLHTVRLSGFGDLSLPNAQRPSVERFVKDDLAGRLLPAVEVAWPAAIPVVAGLLDFVGLFEDRIDDSSTLVHNDLHMGNVLCTKGDAGEVRCVGLLDLETAMAAPPEADIAAIQVHHGPLFQQPIEGDWFERVLAGYDRPLDRHVTAFFRVLHHLNMGYYSALIGHDWHAEQVVAAARAELGALRRGIRRCPPSRGIRRSRRRGISSDACGAAAHLSRSSSRTRSVDVTRVGDEGSADPVSGSR